MQDLNSYDQPKRPVFLTVLSVFSLIAIGFGILSSFLGLFAGPLSSEELEMTLASSAQSAEQLKSMGEADWAETIYKIMNLVVYTNANFYVDKLLNLVIYSIGLVGVVSMLRLRKIGFHFYIVYNILALFSIYASAPIDEVPTFYLGFFGVIAAIFVFMYSRMLRYLK